ncbi:MAG: shikimate dehydrogenase family protein [Bacteroidia bacterium]
MRIFGLIGYPLNHSFSPDYFNKKFQNQGIDAVYKAFSIPDINLLNIILNENPKLEGLNVTIPYKKAVIPFLNDMHYQAKTIGAVNCIKIEIRNNKPFLIGYNTDNIGFEKSLIPLLKKHHTQALILGNGGAAKAVAFVLKKLNIPFSFLVRNPNGTNEFAYSGADKKIFEEHKIIINTTPLGMFPDIEKCPDIPYENINETHLLYDLIYNPEESLFLKKGKLQGAQIKNGYEMLVLQAESSWNIWNKN